MAEDTLFDRTLKVLPVLGAVVTFVWGVWVWKDNAEAERVSAEAAARKDAENRRIEASKPFLDLQLQLYAETARLTAKIVTSDDPAEVDRATKRFWELYWSELVVVEDGGVASAMKKFGDALNSPDHTAANLRPLSLDLGRQIQASVAKSWNTAAWNTR